MKPHVAASCLVFLSLVAVHGPEVRGVELIARKTSQGTVVGYQDTPLMPWTGNKYHVHDPDRPIPESCCPDPWAHRCRRACSVRCHRAL